MRAAWGLRGIDEMEDGRKRLQLASGAWVSVDLTSDCQRLARSLFPVEPVRTLDALHLATALVAREWIEDLQILSLDDRLRVNAQALGFLVLPK